MTKEENRKYHRLYMRNWRRAKPGRCSQYEKKWRDNNKDLVKGYRAGWRRQNMGLIRERANDWGRISRGRLSDDYVAQTLGMAGSKLPRIIIEAKRAQLRLFRASHGRK